MSNLLIKDVSMNSQSYQRRFLNAEFRCDLAPVSLFRSIRLTVFLELCFEHPLEDSFEEEKNDKVLVCWKKIYILVFNYCSFFLWDGCTNGVILSISINHV